MWNHHICWRSPSVSHHPCPRQNFWCKRWWTPWLWHRARLHAPCETWSGQQTCGSISLTRSVIYTSTWGETCVVHTWCISRLKIKRLTNMAHIVHTVSVHYKLYLQHNLTLNINNGSHINTCIWTKYKFNTLTLCDHWATCHSFSQWLSPLPLESQSAQSHSLLSHSHHKPP